MRSPHGPRQLNRECGNCIPPCQGGEKLHRRGPCCKSYCACEGFVERTGPVLTDVLVAAVVKLPKVPTA